MQGSFPAAGRGLSGLLPGIPAFSSPSLGLCRGWSWCGGQAWGILESCSPPARGKAETSWTLLDPGRKRSHFLRYLTRVHRQQLQRKQARQFQRRKRSQLAHSKERQEEALPLHQAPDAGAGEGVSVQHVPYSRAAPRDQPQRPPHGQTS
uniref:Uncharacterized protein n=1 Tax=Felis catus TaxID=9685 RepID=A0ABI7XIK5_FELCA